jgi:hypothetical protein
MLWLSALLLGRGPVAGVGLMVSSAAITRAVEALGARLSPAERAAHLAFVASRSSAGFHQPLG